MKLVMLLVALLLSVVSVKAQDDIELGADSKIGYVVIGILLGCALLGMFIRIKDVYLYKLITCSSNAYLVTTHVIYIITCFSITHVFLK